MKNALKLSHPESVIEVRRRLDLWRKTRTQRGPIPASLWEDASRLARVHGVHPIAQALRLDYYALKRQMGVAHKVEGPAQPAFVEVAVVPVAPLPELLECAVELERPDGALMRVRLSRREDLVALAESFWRCRA